MANKKKIRIRMRINKHSDSVCETCGEGSSQVLEMFDLMIGSTIHTICDRCADQIFHKTLSATCGINAKVKSQHDLAIIRKRNSYTSNYDKHISLNEALSDIKDSGDDE